jgi:hypothetical protein
MPKSVNERVKKSDDKNRAKGFTGRKVWATPEEHLKINALLLGLRKSA